MSGFIFLIVIDWIMKNVTERNNTGIRWKFIENLVDLDFADDSALLSSNFQHMQTKVTKLNNYARKTGLKINSKKNKVLRINSKSNNNVTIAGQQLNEVDKHTVLTWVKLSVIKVEGVKILIAEYAKQWAHS